MSPRTQRWAAGALALGLLVLAYLPLLQTIPNGSEHYFMIDVGETQTVLNVWGTLHMTGYPLYVMLGAPLVALFRALGVGAAAAPGLLSLVTMLAALAAVYAVALRLTGRPWVSGAATLAFGLTRTAWIHAEIAEIYALTLLMLALLFVIALWPRRPETDLRRLYLLAFLGGLAVAHHRAVAMAIPALVFLMGPVLTASPRALPKRLLICLAFGLLGFLPYIWLPLRAQAGAAWVYGEPGTWAGFVEQFMGLEASRFIGPPATSEGLVANLQLVWQVLVIDLTLPGLILGVAGLLVALVSPARRRGAIAMLLLAGAALAFHGLAYTDVLSALILMITWPLAMGWALLADAALRKFAPLAVQPSPRTVQPSPLATEQPSPPTPLPQGEGSVSRTFGLSPLAQGGEQDTQPHPPAPSPLRREGEKSQRALHPAPPLLVSVRAPGGEVASPVRASERRRVGEVAVRLAVFAAFALLILALVPANAPFIHDLVTDPTGEETIALAQRTPPGATLMIPWGPRYFAVGFSRDVLGTFPDSVQLVDHRADYRAILDSGRTLVTPPDTFYIQSPAWWAERLGGPAWLTAAEAGLVQISDAPRLADAPHDAALPEPRDVTVACRADAVDLTVDWAGPATPLDDWSVYVHGLDTSGAMVGQGDQSAPVFGWRPLSSWAAGELVRDVYTLPHAPGLTELRYGFYRVRPDGTFENADAWTVPVTCEAGA